MTRPLILCTTNRDVLAEVAGYLPGPVSVTTFRAGIPPLFDEALLEHGDPVVAFTPDTANGWDQPSPAYEAVLLYLDAADVHWSDEGLAWLAPADFLRVPHDLPVLAALLTRGQIPTPHPHNRPPTP